MQLTGVGVGVGTGVGVGAGVGCGVGVGAGVGVGPHASTTPQSQKHCVRAVMLVRIALHTFRQSVCNVLTSFRMFSFESFGDAADTDEKKTMEHVKTIMRSLLAIMLLQVGCGRGFFLHSPDREERAGSSARNQQEIMVYGAGKGRKPLTSWDPASSAHREAHHVARPRAAVARGIAQAAGQRRTVHTLAPVCLFSVRQFAPAFFRK